MHEYIRIYFLGRNSSPGKMGEKYDSVSGDPEKKTFTSLDPTGPLTRPACNINFLSSDRFPKTRES